MQNEEENTLENDFWKNILVKMQQENMKKTCSQRFDVQNAEKEFESFQKKHPLTKADIQKDNSSLIWEIFITKTVKLRVFVQNQTKLSFVQEKNNSKTKIADAKFPNNPFEEIELLLQNKDSYETQLERDKLQLIHQKKQQKVTGELIKALLMKKFKNTQIIWDVYPKDTENFTLIIKNKGNELEKNISMKNFVSDIKNFQI